MLGLFIETQSICWSIQTQTPFGGFGILVYLLRDLGTMRQLCPVTDSPSNPGGCKQSSFQLDPVGHLRNWCFGFGFEPLNLKVGHNILKQMKRNEPGDLSKPQGMGFLLASLWNQTGVPTQNKFKQKIPPVGGHSFPSLKTKDPQPPRFGRPWALRFVGVLAWMFPKRIAHFLLRASYIAARFSVLPGTR